MNIGNFLCQQTVIGWQSETEEGVTGLSRLVTEWIPLCITNIMPFSAMLLSTEVSLRRALGESPW
jgi:hypothetical protein